MSSSVTLVPNRPRLVSKPKTSTAAQLSSSRWVAVQYSAIIASSVTTATSVSPVGYQANQHDRFALIFVSLSCAVPIG